jgi:hypothetical protein
MEDFCDEVAFGWVVREIIFNGEFAPKNSSLIWCTDGSIYIGLNVNKITLIDNDFNSLIERSGTGGRFVLALFELFHEEHDEFLV